MFLLIKDFPDALLRELKSRAAKAGMTMKRYIILHLEKAIKGEVKP